MQMQDMYANYHTHTTRCKHAKGSMREYVENAINNGIRILGFADHVPMPFSVEHYSTYRMSVCETEEYVKEIINLREEYKDQIKILIGYEAEYYPKEFKNMLDNIKSFQCDYIIMGQHFIYNEYDGPYVYIPCGVDVLKQYVSQVIEGLSTNKFSYLAHPDVITFVGDNSLYIQHMTTLCEAAKELKIPLEFNLLGFQEKRSYPSKPFWELVSKIGNQVVIGCDAHKPELVGNKKIYNEALDFLNSLKITPVKEIELKPIK